MAVAYETIRKKFETIRNFIEADLDLIFAPDVGGNYVGVSLVTCACDALARNYYDSRHKGGKLFAEKLLPPNWRPLGLTIYVMARLGMGWCIRTRRRTLLWTAGHLCSACPERKSPT